MTLLHLKPRGCGRRIVLPGTRLSGWGWCIWMSWRRWLLIGHSRATRGLGRVGPWGRTRGACRGVSLRGDLHRVLSLFRSDSRGQTLQGWSSVTPLRPSLACMEALDMTSVQQPQLG